jgi:hypothetical protein
MPEPKSCTNEGGCGLIYRRACTPRAASCHAPRGDDAVRRVRLPRGGLIHPCQHLSESSSVFARVSFFDPIFKGSFGGLPELKMGHVAYRRKALDVSFQQYKVCTNRSSDERVMAPGSQGVGAVFVCFSGEDSGQTGDAIGEPRVPRRSWSRHLSNALGLGGQLVASRKDSVREGGCLEGKMRFVPSALFLKSCPSSRAYLT